MKEEVPQEEQEVSPEEQEDSVELLREEQAGLAEEVRWNGAITIKQADLLVNGAYLG